MNNTTRTVYHSLLTRLGELNGVADVTKTFAVDPSVQQKLETKMQESSEFLGKINIIGVTEKEGEKLKLGISGPVASRTDTNKSERQPRDLTELGDDKYRCVKTNFDTHIPYAKLDAWAKFADFQTRIRDVILRRQALDRMVIGFHGASVADTSDIATYPLLQDVNKGWLQNMREHAPQRVMGSGQTAGTVSVGAGAGSDYANLDAAVFDAITLLDPWFRDDTGLVVMVGRELMHDKYFPLVNQKQSHVETLAADVVISQKRIGGLQAVSVPYFPANAFLITRFDNLSIYFQDGARRRQVVENPKRDRIENYESSNDAYVIEDYGMAALVEHVELVN
ncbi:MULTISPECIES: phage major capsid protein, P2 family [unclassified Undibacterium]|uniref:phage major capsid protein, P2 family n=1 Tax=unclassified Undibacterium TaxID=2630295 RepID=UPI002AC9A2BD|nr:MULTISPECIES: phage major capsid protein, P2 family [unclassified Undibacterium]MEB0138008.1 phage major capsid protein, P2 family [Undibacterium sp. CCC2.1]MEB0170659.1 phage major capsid protein, P2 family [Undibacterium sp. CCC1.1]MEB0177000.1 phage major capsid protein, P2 family [Undibacterium sp. CCC3.4]MEB0216288.1 phage major capsid protein, P2 family [Undibacterium sp. 5I2]WPX42474.1 phage major capsid protein, P2 family [Undibacterium sp. CCC3.4]